MRKAQSGKLTEPAAVRRCFPMKLTLAAVAAVLICLISLAARSMAMRAAQGGPDKGYAEQERLALEAIDGHLRGTLQRLSKR